MPHDGRSQRPWDHPRVCGEKPLQSSVNCTMEGSPPRMRGKAILRSSPAQLVGITPAYAGKRSACSPPSPHSRDHPRVCGEKVLNTFIMVCHVGSPPRMRGKGDSPPFFWTDSRITPAYAGKSPQGLRTAVHSRDHPRVCGEKARTLIVQNEPQGSPPRMRGKALTDPCIALCHGITPACAGKSLRPDNNPSTSWDHPRVCGEKTKKIP